MFRNKWDILFAALIVNTLFRFKPFCFQFGNLEENHTSFAVGQALSWIFLLLYIRDIPKSINHKILFEVTAWCAVSNLFDELFFNPLVLGKNEVFFALIITIRTFWIYNPWKTPKSETR